MAKKIDAAEAVKAFAKLKIQVQTARELSELMVKGKDGGRDREAFETKMAPLAAAHVLSAMRADDGTVTIVTSDGKKYSTAAE